MLVSPVNLLSCYDDLDLSTIATQLAVLETATYPNALSTGLKQSAKAAAEGVNWIWRRLTGNNGLKLPDAPTLAEQVVRQAQSYASFEKTELVEKVLTILKVRLECKECDREHLSALLIREAASGLDVDENLLLGQQAEEVASRYWKSVWKTVCEQVKKQSPEQADQMKQLINQRLAEMSPAERLELQKLLNLAELSGESVRNVLLQSAGPLAGIAVVNMAGFGAYVALSVIIHAIFTTMLGITLPFAFYTSASSLLSLLAGPFGIAIAILVGVVGAAFGQQKLNRSQYAMIVWSCATIYRGAFYTPTDLLPSSQSLRLLTAGKGEDSVGNDPDQSDKELSKRAIERQLAESTSQKAENDLRRTQSELEKIARQLERAETRLKQESLNAAATNDELKRRAAIQNRLEDEIRRISAERQDLLAKVEAAESRARSAQDQLEHTRGKYDANVECRRREIERLWVIHFPKFIFASKALRWTAEKTFPERLEIERALIELRDAQNPVALSRSKMNSTGEHHAGFKLSPNAPARIFYRAHDGKVEITRILKKNEM